MGQKTVVLELKYSRIFYLISLGWWHIVITSQKSVIV